VLVVADGADGGADRSKHVQPVRAAPRRGSIADSFVCPVCDPDERRVRSPHVLRQSRRIPLPDLHALADEEPMARGGKLRIAVGEPAGVLR
jgi:hypothetical protein